MQPKLQCCRLDTHSSIHYPAGHTQGNRNVSVLYMLGVPGDTPWRDRVLAQQMLHEHPRPRTGLAIHKTQSMPGKVG